MELKPVEYKNFTIKLSKVDRGYSKSYVALVEKNGERSFEYWMPVKYGYTKEQMVNSIKQRIDLSVATGVEPERPHHADEIFGKDEVVNQLMRFYYQGLRFFVRHEENGTWSAWLWTSDHGINSQDFKIENCSNAAEAINKMKRKIDVYSNYRKEIVG
jgi:hypothetical protein